MYVFGCVAICSCISVISSSQYWQLILGIYRFPQIVQPYSTPIYPLQWDLNGIKKNTLPVKWIKHHVLITFFIFANWKMPLQVVQLILETDRMPELQSVLFSFPPIMSQSNWLGWILPIILLSYNISPFSARQVVLFV